jgi:hypothetical protein
MKTLNIKLFLLSLLILGACRTWDEDFNTDLNRPQVTPANPVPPHLFMGGMIDGVTSTWSYPQAMLNVMAPVCEYTGKSYSLSQANRHRSWHDLDGCIFKPTYQNLRSVRNLRRAAIATEDPRYVAIADIWESYVLYTITTLSGPVPYYKVIDDSDEFHYVYNYDDQAEIYPSLIEKFKNAGLMIKADDDMIDAQADYVYGGDIQKWKKMANTFCVKLALNMYNASPDAAKAVINEILSDPQTYPVFESNADNFTVHYDGVFRISPWRVMGDWLLKENLVSNVMVERLITLKDPRLTVYAKPVQKYHTDADNNVVPSNPGSVKYLGHIYGITTSNGDATNWNGGLEYGSRIGDWFISVDDNMKTTDECSTNPLVLSTYSELNFILAEMAKRNIIAGGDAAAQAYYREGIEANMNYYQCQFLGDAGYDGAYGQEGLASFGEYFAQPQVSWDGGRDHLTLIAEQKWLSTYFLGFEAYIDHRRTMKPELRASHRADGYQTSGSGTKFPARTDYPTSEMAENTVAVEEANATGFDIPVTGAENRTIAKMWLINNPASPDLQMPIFQEPLKANEEHPGQANFKTWYDAHWDTMFWWKHE